MTLYQREDCLMSSSNDSDVFIHTNICSELCLQVSGLQCMCGSSPSLTCSSFYHGRNARKWLHITRQHLYNRNEPGRKICPTAKNYSSRRWWAPKKTKPENYKLREKLQQRGINSTTAVIQELSQLDGSVSRVWPNWNLGPLPNTLIRLSHDMRHIRSRSYYLATFPFPGCWCPSVCRHGPVNLTCFSRMTPSHDPPRYLMFLWLIEFHSSLQQTSWAEIPEVSQANTTCRPEQHCGETEGCGW